MPATEHHRILVYGMQSSGASIVTILLAQLPESLAVVDLWAPYVAPRLSHRAGPAIVKATIVTGIGVDDHVESFRPTRTVLVLRHPADVVRSLADKSYRDYCGSLEEKLAKYDSIFTSRDRFDAVIHYEEVVVDPGAVVARLSEVGVNVPDPAGSLSRSPNEIIDYARTHSAWCRSEWRSRWGIGRARNVRLGTAEPFDANPVRNPGTVRTAARFAPAVTAFYDRRPST